MAAINGDLSQIIEEAQQSIGIAHPFNPAPVTLDRINHRPQVSTRQKTEMFYCPKQLDEYDECCNRVFAGEITVRYEDRTFTKEGELLIVISYTINKAPQRPAEISVSGDEEPPVRPYRLQRP